jgi:hypothetical protein
MWRGLYRESVGGRIHELEGSFVVVVNTLASPHIHLFMAFLSTGGVWVSERKERRHGGACVGLVQEGLLFKRFKITTEFEVNYIHNINKKKKLTIITFSGLAIC